MPDRHKTKPKAVRMPDGLLARVETSVKGTPESVNAFIVGAIEERLARRESGSTVPAAAPARGSTTRARKPKADSAPPAQFREPEDTAPAAAFRPPVPRAHALNCKCGICKPGR